jgi:phage baseplate assembly protein W
VIDFRFIRPRRVLRVQSIAPIRGFSPPSIVVVGDGMEQADEVVINGESTTTFAVSAADRLVVQVPESQVGTPIASIQVFAALPQVDSSAQILMSTDQVKKIEGVERLIQSFLIVLLTTPGSDAFEPASGGGLLGLVGRPTDAGGKGIAADVATAVERTKAELLKLQSKNRKIPPSERLLSATLVSVNFDQNSTILSATVEITNSMGDSAQVNVSG